MTYEEFLKKRPDLKEIADAPVFHDTWRSSCAPHLIYQKECVRHLDEAFAQNDQARIESLFEHEDFAKKLPREKYLCDKAAKGEIDVVKSLLSLGFNPNSVFSDFTAMTTPLAEAVSSEIEPSRKLELVNALLDAGANPHLALGIGREQSAFEKALGYDKEGAIVKAMLESRASKENSNRGELLTLAVYQNSLIGIEALVAQGTDVNVRAFRGQTPLVTALIYGCTKAMAALLDKGADPDIPDEAERTALHHAAYDGKVDDVQTLLKKGASVDAMDQYGTALHQAAYGGKIEIMKALLEAGADVNKLNAFGTTPLMRAVQASNRDVVALLLEKGADASVRHRTGAAALDMAGNHGEIKKLLEKHNAKPGTPAFSLPSSLEEYVDRKPHWISTTWSLRNTNKRGGTYPPVRIKEAFEGASREFLLDAVSQNDSVQLKAMLALEDIDIGILDEALQSAVYEGNAETVDLLLDKGCNPSRVQYGTTALNVAARKGDIELLKKMLDKGAEMGDAFNINQAVYKRTALSLAVAYKNKEAEELLRAYGATD